MEAFYQNILSFIHQRPILKKTLITIAKYFPYMTFCMYPCILIILYITKSSQFFHAVWKPLFAFIYVTIIRKIINRPRPYDAYSIQSLIGHKHGESFPSRHTVSAFIIALVAFYVQVPLGIFAIIIAIIISVSRILCGVHYISDVIVSICIAFAIYYI